MRCGWLLVGLIVGAGSLLACGESKQFPDAHRNSDDELDGGGIVEDGALPDAPVDGDVDDAAGADAPAADAGSPDAVVADAGPADAGPPQQFYWADWTAATAGAPGSASGSFAAPSGTVTITYAGQVQFAQTTPGTNYWVPGDPYVNAVTANPPPDSDIIALTGGPGTNTLTFDPPVTGLVMGIVSLGAGSNNVKYDFDRPITLLSYGAGYWGNGVIVVEDGDVISGSEGHGAIQFAGTVASVSWTVVGVENWHGFSLGIPAQ
jgi:hypothetical protein